MATVEDLAEDGSVGLSGQPEVGDQGSGPYSWRLAGEVQVVLYVIGDAGEVVAHVGHLADAQHAYCSRSRRRPVPATGIEDASTCGDVAIHGVVTRRGKGTGWW